MKITRTIYLGALSMIAAALLGACGSASAPPIDLPAPITGRVDVSSPDDSGNVTVTGTEGAVTGGALVMVVNEGEAESASIKLMDYLIPSAYAVEYPETCSVVGHACVYAEDDGSFVVVIAASAEDPLTIGLIYPYNGAWRSEQIQLTVPTPAEPEENCAGLGLSGKAVDVEIAPVSGVPVLLKQGSDTTTNQLVIGAAAETTVAVNGCYAHSLAIRNISGADRIVVTSKDDKTIWMGKFQGGAFTDERAFTLSDEPMHAMFIEAFAAPLVAFKTASSVALSLVSMIDGSMIQTLSISLASAPLEGLTRSLSLDSLKMANDYNQYLGLLITDKGDNVDAYVTLFRADDLAEDALTVQRTGLAGLAGAPSSIVDGALYVYNSEEVDIAILDSAIAGTNNLVDAKIYYDTTYLLNETSDLNYSKLSDIKTGQINQHPTLEKLEKVVVKRSTSPEVAFAVAADGLLLMQQLTYLFPYETASWAPSGSIVALDLNDDLQLMYGADVVTGAVIDGSGLVY